MASGAHYRMGIGVTSHTKRRRKLDLSARSQTVRERTRNAGPFRGYVNEDASVRRKTVKATHVVSSLLESTIVRFIPFVM